MASHGSGQGSARIVDFGRHDPILARVHFEAEEAIRRLYAVVLRQCGYSVVVASNAADALRVACGHAGPIHLLVSDVVMPQMGGRQLAERRRHVLVRPEDAEPGARNGPQHVVPAGIWQAAVPRGDRYALAGCTVAPGFDFADFTMPSRGELLAQFPEHAELVERLTRG